MGSVLGEAGLVAAVVAFHVADHRLVDERLHLVTHLGAGIAATAGAFALGADRSDLGLDADRLVPAARAGLLAAAERKLPIAMSRNEMMKRNAAMTRIEIASTLMPVGRCSMAPNLQASCGHGRESPGPRGGLYSRGQGRGDARRHQ